MHNFCSCRLGNTHENSNINVLNQIYNTLHNQNTTIKEPNLCSCRLELHTQPMWDKHQFFLSKQ